MTPIKTIYSERTLCFILDHNKILLALKKLGQGSGNYNGFGGKKESDETIEEAAVREVFEESGVTIKTEYLEKVAVIDFYFPSKPEWNQRVHVYFCKRWSGEPKETDEMRPQWFTINNVPYGQMWKSDTTWLPTVLSGKKIKATYHWKEDNKTVDDYKIFELTNSNIPIEKKVLIKVSGDLIENSIVLDDIRGKLKQGSIVSLIYGFGTRLSDQLNKNGIPFKYVNGIRETDEHGLQIAFEVSEEVKKKLENEFKSYNNISFISPIVRQGNQIINTNADKIVLDLCDEFDEIIIYTLNGREKKNFASLDKVIIKYIEQ